MSPETNATFIVNAYWMFGISATFLLGLLAIVWKAKSEFGDTIQASIGSLRAEMQQAMQQTLDPLRSDIRALSDRIANHDQDIGSLKGRYGDARSPMKPNDAGKKLLADSGFNNAYAALRDRVFRRMDELGTRTLYDSEENARAVLEELKNEPALDAVKEYVVNHPKEPLDLVLSVAAWNIRDDYWDAKSK